MNRLLIQQSFETSNNSKLMDKKRRNINKEIAFSNIFSSKLYDKKVYTIENSVESKGSSKRTNDYDKSSFCQNHRTKSSNIVKNDDNQIIIKEEQNTKKNFKEEFPDIYNDLNKLLDNFNLLSSIEVLHPDIKTIIGDLTKQINELLLRMEQASITDFTSIFQFSEKVLYSMAAMQGRIEQNNVNMKASIYSKFKTAIDLLMQRLNMINNDTVENSNIEVSTVDTGTVLKDFQDKSSEILNSAGAIYQDAMTDENKISAMPIYSCQEDVEQRMTDSNHKAKLMNGSKLADYYNQSSFKNTGRQKDIINFDLKTQKNTTSSIIIQDFTLPQNSYTTIHPLETEKIENTQVHKTTFLNIIEQVVDKAEIAIRDKNSEMFIQLKPDHLGKLSMKIAVEKGIVIAKIVAENQIVKEILESNYNLLKDALSHKGFGIQEFSVSVGQDSQFKGHQGFMNHKKHKNSKTVINDTMVHPLGTSEGKVEIFKSINTTNIDFLA